MIGLLAGKGNTLNKVRGALLTEDWAQLALAIGYDPIDVEGQGRDILRRIAATGVTIRVRKEEQDQGRD